MIEVGRRHQSKYENEFKEDDYERVNRTNKLKNRKISNQDQIPKKLIKYSEEIVTEKYTKLLNIIIQRGKTTEDWK